ncbi:MAG: hypothetical protein ACRD3M_08725 [Thermoanaerobaculia bacterium]
MRAAAVADFLQDLRAHGSADLNALLATLNEGSLVREALGHWTGKGWIVIAPSTPLQALTGPGFSRGLTLEQFCGGGAPENPPEKEDEEPHGDENP